MKHLFNQLIIKILPYLPLLLVRTVAIKYVAGETSQDALRIVQNLNKQGFSVTLDILGEHTRNENTAKNITKDYQKLLQKIHEKNLNCNLSIKPSHIGMDIHKGCIDENISQLLETARDCENFIRIDMEDSSLTDATIQLYKKCKKQYNHVGTVLQAYLFRSAKDLNNLSNKNRFNVRICKGIYREPEDIAIQGRQAINNNFLKLLQFAFENNIYVGIATHDLFLIKESYKLITDLKIPKDRFEFQVLYGVPMSGWLEKHLENDYKVRVYVPFGKDWYDYSVRRLKENPNIAGYVIRDMFRR